ncbi:MAG: hypothetical protein QOE09_3361 [Ilumatobacteraceae bacterium]|jgi:hypothetical protein
MQEFESISASSYDPSALATKLTAKAAEGWSVVAIVPTGGDVTAFLSREKDGASDGATDSSSTPESAAATPDVENEQAPDESSLQLPAETPAEPEPEPESKPDEINEPSGWAIAPEPTPSPSNPTTSVFEPTGVQPAVTIAPATTYEPTATPSYEVAADPVSSAPAAPEPAPAPAVPAGWYADPAGRFELRYWDGSTWTEHVSRAGQQFTDPPVA